MVSCLLVAVALLALAAAPAAGTGAAEGRQRLALPSLAAPAAPEAVRAGMLDWQPLIIRGECAGEEWRETRAAWGSFEALADDIGDLVVRVGRGPYPADDMLLRDYLNTCSAAAAAGHPETQPPPRVVFQYGGLPLEWTLRQACDDSASVGPVMTHSLPLHEDKTSACRLLKRFRIPSFLRGHVPVLHGGLLIGPEGDAIEFHKHTDAANVLLAGRKRWRIRNATHEFAGVQDAGDVVVIPGDMEHGKFCNVASRPKVVS